MFVVINLKGLSTKQKNPPRLENIEVYFSFFQVPPLSLFSEFGKQKMRKRNKKKN